MLEEGDEFGDLGVANETDWSYFRMVEYFVDGGFIGGGTDESNVGNGGERIGEGGELISRPTFGGPSGSGVADYEFFCGVKFGEDFLD